MCPWNYKCCPLTQGMQCFAPCPQWSEPCQIECPFGLKVNPSPCTTCECAESPCLSASCPRGTLCTVKEYEPCAIKGRCGFTSECVRVVTNQTNPITKPKRCPDYWPRMSSGGGNFLSCDNSDGECPDDQKCCRGPAPSGGFGPNRYPPQQSEPVNYCVDPCESLANCTLQCSLGLRILDGCQVCQCVEDACLTTTCPQGKRCEMLPAPCAYYEGMPPCPRYPVCM